MVELQERLINDDYFSCSKDDLVELFDEDGLKDGQSLSKLKDLGGYEGLTSKLRTNFQTGISQDATDLSHREKHFGSNAAIQKPIKTLWSLITVQFEDEILRILCYAASVSLVLGIATEGLEKGWMEGFAIFVAVIIIVSVTALNDYEKEKQFRKLYASAEAKNVNVTRGGKIENISIYDLLVGDILSLETGDNIPVDGIVVQAHDMVVDESNVTGESDPFKKNRLDKLQEDQTPFLISGSLLQEGSGQCVVVAVGTNSLYGRTKALVMEEKDDGTPLQDKLDVLAGQIGDYGELVAKLVFFAMTIHLIVEDIYYGKNIFVMQTLNHLVEYFIIAVTVVVVAVPEGLPLAVTIALAYSVGKMKDEKNLVRKLDTCETMGGANNICSDKTGTLTQNKMDVVALWSQEQDLKIFDHKTLSESKESQEKLCVGICLNSNAQPKITRTGIEQIGNKTECALLELAYKLGYNFQDIRSKYNVVKVIPFSSAKKRMTVITQLDSNNYRVFVKGAPDWLDEYLVNYIDRSGNISSVDEEFQLEKSKMIKSYADMALRTLLLSYRDISASEVDLSQDTGYIDNLVVQNLTFVAIAGIQDPLRPDVPQAIQTCKEAGVIVRMVTGDVKDTAIAISKNAGILGPNYDPETDKYAVLTGKEFREFVGGLKTIELDGEKKFEVNNMENFKIVYQNTKVIARSSPSDKFLLVTGIKQLGEVVAVTGDGSNDAPALSKADVGFAMGITGTDVAKHAAGIILTDDNFSSIVTAIKWGRNIFDCIRKFLQFQVTVNIVAMFMVFLGGVILRESPLNTIQMLWVNLIMDTMASLALATEPPTDELLKRKPYGRLEAMITPIMWRNIICHGIWQIMVLLVVLFNGPTIFGIPNGIQNEEWTYENGVHYTMFFNIFVYMQVFNEINARKLKRTEKNVFQGFFNNFLFLAVLIITIAVQILITQYGGYSVKCAPLEYRQHVICLVIGALSLVVGFVIKFIPEGCFNQIAMFRNLEEDIGKPNIIHQLRQSRSVLRKSSSKLRKIQPN